MRLAFVRPAWIWYGLLVTHVLAGSLAAERGVVSQGSDIGDSVCAEQLKAIARMVEKNDFAIKRALSDYYFYLGQEFRTAIFGKLGPEDQWLDAGCGAGYAQAGYHLQSVPGTPRRAKTLGVTVVLPPEGIAMRAELAKAGYGDRHQFLFGNFIEDMPADYLYFDAADKLLQSRILPRSISTGCVSWPSIRFE